MQERKMGAAPTKAKEPIDVSPAEHAFARSLMAGSAVMDDLYAAMPASERRALAEHHAANFAQE